MKRPGACDERQEIGGMTATRRTNSSELSSNTISWPSSSFMYRHRPAVASVIHTGIIFLCVHCVESTLLDLSASDNSSQKTALLPGIQQTKGALSIRARNTRVLKASTRPAFWGIVSSR